MNTTRVAYGLTGQIGAGKTYVGKLLSKYGCAVYNADQQAQHILLSDQELRAKIAAILGTQAFTPTGLYNREYVAQEIFKNPTLRSALEGLIHPAVFADFSLWKDRCETQLNFVFMESALLPRLNWRPYFRAIVLITAPETLRLQRIIQRDNTTPQRALERMAAQPTTPEYYQVAHFVLENSPRFDLTTEVEQLVDILQLQNAN